jgi:hypothetical protein
MTGFSRIARLGSLDPFEFRDERLLDPLVEKARYSCHSFSKAAKVYFNNASANAALSARSANAISDGASVGRALWVSRAACRR